MYNRWTMRQRKSGGIFGEQMKKAQNYRESLANTPGPSLLKDIPPMVIDYRGLIKYAREKGVQPVNLSEQEKEKFIIAKDG